MKIAVLIKQVPGSDSSLPIQNDASWIDEEAITYVMNESDNYALEEALQIREQNGNGEVIVISLGPDRVQKVIREGLAKGADFLGPSTGGAVDILGKGGTKPGFDMATLKAASVPLTQGTMDLAFAEQTRLNKQQIIDDALGGLGEGATDADRAFF